MIVVDTSGDDTARDTVTPQSRDDVRDNPREAVLIAELLAALLLPLAPAAQSTIAREVGVISPYRKQNNRIRQELAERLGDLASLIRVDTVDRFQGGECDIVLVSLVASNPAASIGSLHADWRRMNVAISRARAKVVIVGSRRTFVSSSTPEEEPAKERYRRLYTLADVQSARGEAGVLRSPTDWPAARPWQRRRERTAPDGLERLRAALASAEAAGVGCHFWSQPTLGVPVDQLEALGLVQTIKTPDSTLRGSWLRHHRDLRRADQVCPGAPRASRLEVPPDDVWARGDSRSRTSSPRG